MSFFGGQAGPVEIVGIPGLSQQAAGVAHENWERRQIQQLARVTLRQDAMWHSKVSRQTFPVHLVGVALRESCKLFTGRSEGAGLLRKSTLIFSCQIESVRRHQVRKHFGQVS